MASLEVLNGHELKKSAKLSTRCSICAKNIMFGVELSIIKTVKKYPFPHIVLHGNPIHAMIVYLDANFLVRGVEAGESIEVMKDSNTFAQILKKWSNPF